MKLNFFMLIFPLLCMPAVGQYNMLGEQLEVLKGDVDSLSQEEHFVVRIDDQWMSVMQLSDIRLRFDDHGRLIRKIYNHEHGYDLNENSRHFYDQEGKKTLIHHYRSDDELNRIDSLFYLPDGNLSQIRSYITYIMYSTGEPRASLLKKSVYAYDGKGITQVRLFDDEEVEKGTEKYIRNEYGRLLSYELIQEEELPVYINYEYYDDGTLKFCEYSSSPDQWSERYYYDQNGYVDRIMISLRSNGYGWADPSPVKENIRTIQNLYRLDDAGNWIQRDTKVKEGDDEWQMNNITLRRIVYR